MDKKIKLQSTATLDKATALAETAKRISEKIHDSPWARQAAALQKIVDKAAPSYQFPPQAFQSFFDSSTYQSMQQAVISQQQYMENLSLPLEKIAEIGAQLGSAFSNLSFSKYDLFDEVEAEIEDSDNPELLITETSRIKQVIQDIYKNNELIFKVDPRKFEEIIAELLYAKGFEVELSKQTRDKGYDIIALNNLNGFPVKYLVECKRHASHRPVGISIVRGFCDVITTENANKGIIVTSSYFSPECHQRAQCKGYLLDLKDRKDILTWAHEYLNIR